MKTDAQLQADVIDELKWEPEIDESEIGVAVHNGVATLTGTVKNYAQKMAAEAAAWRVHGVKAVAEEIEVRLPDGAARTDADIAESVLNALRWNVSLPFDAIRVQVEHGWITLNGEVNWQYQRNAATDAVRHLHGVNGVSNLIRVKPVSSAPPKVSAAEVREKISKALERSADVDASQIRVDTHESEVVLEGSVRSFSERQDAERAAWSAPGVTRVTDRIKISV